MVSNDFIVADFAHEQSLNYTYFCDANSTRTWIDHCLSSKNDIDNIITCRILPLDENLSDHLPILTTVKIHYDSVSPSNVEHGRKQFAQAKWDNHTNNDKYKQYLQHKLSDLGSLTCMENLDSNAIQNKLDAYVTKVNDAIHTSAAAAGCTQQRKFKPKPYWCPRLSQLRDKKRFWWRLWVDNGRPRSGSVYDCYKGVKKLFRQVFRQSVTHITNSHYHKLQSLYTNGKIRSFWNEIKNNKHIKVKSSLDPDTFKSFYSGIMQESELAPPLDRAVSSAVDSYYNEHCNTVTIITLKISSLVTLAN
jgi:hypothetical protein